MNAMDKPNGPRMLLVFGPDETAAHAIAMNMAKKLSSMERVDLDGDMLKSEPALLADEASSQSLFGDKRYIRLSLKRDEAMPAIENLMHVETAENIVIATAGNLTKASKLRKLAQSSPHIAYHICYQTNARDLVPLLVDDARAKGLKLDRSLASQIAKSCNNNRVLALIEIEKLSLYYDAPRWGASPMNVSPEAVSKSNGRSNGDLIEALKEDFEKLSADAAADNQGDLINAILSGNIKQSGEQLSEARATGLNTISIVRALQRRITMLAAMRPQIDGGRSAAEVAKRNPAVFWKEESIVALQLTTWTSQRLAALITHLLKMEGEIMVAKAEFSSILLEQELMRIARAAAALRRKNNAYS